MTSRAVARIARQFKDQQTDQIADVPSVRAMLATVTAVSGGTVTVSWRGSQLTAGGVLASYTPAVNDRVLAFLVDNQLIVIDLIA